MTFTALSRRGFSLALTFAGEATQSLLHFALNIALLRRLPPVSYGAFAIVMLIGGIALTYIRAVAAMPASLAIGRSRSRSAAALHEILFGSAACLLALLIAGATVPAAYYWLGVDGIPPAGFLAAWCVRSYLRASTLAQGRIDASLVGDITFATTGALLSAGLLLRFPAHALEASFTALMFANWLGSAAILAARRVRPRLILGLRLRRRYRRLGGLLSWSALSVTATNLQGQGMAILVAAFAGPTAYAPIAASLVLFVPIRLLGVALANLTQPQIAAALARGQTTTILRESVLWCALAVIGSLLYASVILLASPWLGGEILRTPSAHRVLELAALVTTVATASVMPRIGLEALGRFRRFAAISLVSATIGMAVTTAVLAVSGPDWALLGALASESTLLLLAWFAMARALMPVRPPIRRAAPQATALTRPGKSAVFK